MKWKKQALSLLLTGCIAATTLPTAAFAVKTIDTPTVAQAIDDEAIVALQANNGDTVTNATNLAKKFDTRYESGKESKTVKVENDTITLKKDVTITNYIDIQTENKTLTVDLNGHKISRTGGATVFDVTKGSLTVIDSDGNGTITSNTANGQMLLANGEGAKLTIEGGTITQAKNATTSVVFVGDKSEAIISGTTKIVSTAKAKEDAKAAVAATSGSKLTINGGEIDGVICVQADGDVSKETTLTITDGTFKGKGDYCTVQIGKNTTTKITGGKFEGESGIGVFGANSAFTLSGGTITATKSFGISNNGSTDNAKSIITIDGNPTITGVTGLYLPSIEGKTEISGNPTITGTTGSGIEIRAGQLTVTGNPTVKSEAAMLKCEQNGSGSTTSGAGIAVVQHITKKAITVDIKNGTYEGMNSLFEQNIQENSDNPEAIKLNVEGGNFKGAVDVKDIKKAGAESQTGIVIDPFISGGYYTDDPSDYVVKDKVVVTSDKAGYDFMIGDAPANDVIPEVGKPEVEMPEGEAIPEAEQDKVQAAAEGVKVNDSLLKAYAQDVVNDMTNSEAAPLKDEGIAALKREGVQVNGNDVNLYAETYLEVKPAEYIATGEDTARYTVDIQPYIRYVVSKETDVDKFVFPENKTQDKTVNAVEVDSEPIIVNQEIQMTIPLPTGFLGDKESGPLYVQHGTQTKYSYEYEATVDSYVAPAAIARISTENGVMGLEMAADTDPKKQITFDNENGFANGMIRFNISEETATVAATSTQKYLSLQDAVDALNGKGGEITLLKQPAEDDVPVISSECTITLKTGNATLEEDFKLAEVLKAGNGYKMTEIDSSDGAVFKFEKISTPSTPGTSTGGVTNNHKVTVETATNGTVTASPTADIKEGTKVTLTVTPAEGYVLNNLTVKRSSGEIELTKVDDTTYTFDMPAADVTVTAVFKQASSQPEPPPVEDDTVCAPYTDVDSSYAYHDQVHYMIENKLMTGVAKDTFGLNVVLNRAMVAQILYSKAEPTKPNYTVTKSFSDVKAGDWFANSVTWAETKGVTAGYGDGTFRPYNQVTREELVTMLYGEANQPQVSSNLGAYTDASSVSNWAVKPMTWAIENGVVTGTTATTLSPKNTTPRYQAAIMFYKYFTK